MELQLNQWRSNESEQQQLQQPSAKFPRLPQHEQSQSGALPFFLSEHNTRISSGLSDNNPSFRFPRTGSRFSLGQLQELELQALIYRYVVAGAAVPPELLQPIKRSLLHSPSYLLHHPLQHLEPSLMNTGLWGLAGIELEPRRCRRTDGKKWRCARDVVSGHKYCDRHVHRGRSRSRKPVESTPNVTSRAATSAAGDASRFGFSGSSDSSTIQLLQLNNSHLDSKPEHTSHFQIPDGVDRSDGHILRPFFDDWPRPQKSDYNSGIKTDTMNSKNLSLKLSTGNGDELALGDSRREPPPQTDWGEGWAVNRVASMGGHLAEALRSSTSSSPTSVLHQMARASPSETSYASA